MTDHYEDDAHLDGDFRDLLKPLRDIETPPGLDVKCLNATRERQDSSTAAEHSKPTNNLGMRLHIPFAIAASLMIGLTLGWILRGHVPGNVADSPDAVTPLEIAGLDTRQAALSDLADATSVVGYQDDVGDPMFVAHEFYLCGVGRIQSKSEFQLTGESP